MPEAVEQPIVLIFAEFVDKEIGKRSVRSNRSLGTTDLNWIRPLFAELFGGAGDNKRNNSKTAKLKETKKRRRSSSSSESPPAGGLGALGKLLG